MCALEDQKVQFLFSDTQIVFESFLEDINNLLNSGEIPNLFTPEEKIMINDELLDAYTRGGFIDKGTSVTVIDESGTSLMVKKSED